MFKVIYEKLHKYIILLMSILLAIVFILINFNIFLSADFFKFINIQELQKGEALQSVILSFILFIISLIYFKISNLDTVKITKNLNETNLKFDDLLTISKGKISSIEP